jgi:hypothetical protein
MSRTGWLAAMVFAFMVAASGTALAQQGGGAGGGGGQDGGRGGRGGRGGDFDPAQFRERIMQRYKEELGASDEDWKVIQPKLEKVMAVQRDARSGGGGFGGFGGPGGGRGGRGGDAAGAEREQTPVAKASSELRTALQSKDTPADDIAKRLEAFRAARAKAREDLAAAQKELKEVLTGRQEAQLVVAGMLE